jgi:hypothetical protein
MKKKTVRKLVLHRESIHQLDPQAVKDAAAGAIFTVNLSCTCNTNSRCYPYKCD